MGRIVLADSFGKDSPGIPVIELDGLGQAILGDPAVWSYVGFTAEQVKSLYALYQDQDGTWKETPYTPANPRIVLSYMKMPDEDSDFKISTPSPVLDTSSGVVPDEKSLSGAPKLAVAWAKAWRARLSYLYNTDVQVAMYGQPEEGLLYATSADWKSKDGALGTLAEIYKECPRFTAGVGTLMAVYSKSTNSTYLYLLLTHFIPAPGSDSSSEGVSEFISPLIPNFDPSTGGPVVGMWTVLWWTEPECIKEHGGAVPKVTVTYLSGPKYRQYLPASSGSGVRWALIADSGSLAPIMARRVDGDLLRTPTQVSDAEMLWLAGQMTHRFAVLRDGDTEMSVFEVLV